MKTKMFMLCLVLAFSFGCQKNGETQVDRYKVFPATWEELSNYTSSNGELRGGAFERKGLIKIDSATGRVWFWYRSTGNTNEQSGWIEMTDTGYVIPAALKK